jgi:hypothetical protein
MPKNKCSNCKSTKSKTFWGFDNNKILCDECHKNYMAKLNETITHNKHKHYRKHKRRIISTLLVIIGILLLLVIRSLVNQNGNITQNISTNEKIDNSIIENSMIPPEIKEVTSKIEQEKNNVSIIFYDEKNNCSLNGKIYINQNFVGETTQGRYILTKDQYTQRFFGNDTIKIIGITSSCYENNKNLFFIRTWIVSDLEYYFIHKENIELFFEVNPRSPKNIEEMQKFIRPKETTEYIIQITHDNPSAKEVLDRIAKRQMQYLDDIIMFNKSEYWQTPKEELKNGFGDCEDWAVTTVSAMREYNSSIPCYNLLWPTHLSVMCYYNQNIIIYDMAKTSFSTRISPTYNSDELQKEKKAIRVMLSNYYDDYGFDIKDEKLNAVFNEETYQEFEGNEEFIDWLMLKVNSR